MTNPSNDVTHLLREWSAGDPDALDKLIPLVADEVRDLARRAMDGESPNHTLQPTALVNEVYLKLVDRKTWWWKDRSQFFSALARLMRRILVDHARKKNAEKRGGGEPKMSLDENFHRLPEIPDDILALNEALEELKEIDPERHDIVELWYFMGLKQKEIAREKGLSINTVGRKLKTAKIWLRERMRRYEEEAEQSAPKQASANGSGGSSPEGEGESQQDSHRAEGSADDTTTPPPT
ncbi:MAG: ECF-type sigma factor [Acidobacteriota bacterium]